MLNFIRNILTVVGAIATFGLGLAGLYYGTGANTNFRVSSYLVTPDDSHLTISIVNDGPSPSYGTNIILRSVYVSDRRDGVRALDANSCIDDQVVSMGEGERGYVPINETSSLGISLANRAGMLLLSVRFCLLRDGVLPGERVITVGESGRVLGQQRTWDFRRACDAAMRVPITPPESTCTAGRLITNEYYDGWNF